MSTAIALQDVSTFAHKDSGTIRHRTVSKSSVDDKTKNTWIEEPQDATSTKLPLDYHTLKPTATYWITPHSTCARTITVLDLSKDIAMPYTSMTAEYKAEVKKTLKDHSYTPTLTCKREHWLGLKYTITNDQNELIANWSHPWHSAGSATLTFLSDSPYTSHPISLRNKRWGLRTESFTLNSQPYFWEMDSLWNSFNMTLYRVTGKGDMQRTVEVGKYAQKWWGSFVTGGTLVVDERELSGVVACLTLCVVLKKKRQRAAERHGGE